MVSDWNFCISEALYLGQEITWHHGQLRFQTQRRRIFRTLERSICPGEESQIPAFDKHFRTNSKERAPRDRKFGERIYENQPIGL
jgi:hypothetical protein